MSPELLAAAMAPADACVAPSVPDDLEEKQKMQQTSLVSLAVRRMHIQSV